MSIFEWFKLLRLYRNSKWAAVAKAVMVVLGAQIRLRPASQGKGSPPVQAAPADPGQKLFKVTLENTMFAYDWGPMVFPVRACCADRAIRLATEEAQDYCQVVSVVEVSP